MSNFNDSFIGLAEKYLDPDFLLQIGRETGFIKRKSKLLPHMFLNSLLSTEADQSRISLLSLKGDLHENYNCSVSKVGTHKKFTPEAVVFLKTVFSKLLSEKSTSQLTGAIDTDKFNRIRIKDSTKFRLPSSLINEYPGYRSFNKNSSLMNIQYEFDLKSGDWLEAELTKATRNDQLDSRESVESIMENDLCISDLGYITMPYLKGVSNNNAYFPNRLPPKMGIYQMKSGKVQAIDWKKIHAKMSKNKLPHLAIDVLIDKKEKLKTRMLIVAVSEQTAEGRIRNAIKSGKRKKGYTPTEEYKIKAHYNIFITNVPEELISLAEIPQIYRLRWQIELIFKTWKSLASIDKVKHVKKERFECQLFAKLIWLIFNWRLFQVIDHSIKKASPNNGCSMLKFFNMVNKQTFSFRRILTEIQNKNLWLRNVFIPLIPDLIIEKKKDKDTHLQILNSIFDS